MKLSIVSSSISALDQAQQAKEKSRKNLWLTCFALSTLLAIYQTSYALDSYFRPSMSVTEAEYVNDVNSVATVCYRNKPNYTTEDNKTIDILLKMKNMLPSCDVIRPSLFCLSLLSESDRFQIGYPVQEFGITKDGYDILLHFNNLYFGNCATFGFFNPNIWFMIVYTFETIRTNLEPPIVVIHEKDTSPVFNAENILYVDTYVFFYNLLAKKWIYESNSWSADGACVDDNTTSLQSWNLNNAYFNVTFDRYKYSYKSCLDQCVHNLTKTYCNCILPKSMTNSNEEQLPLCPTICSKIPKDKLDSMCSCKTTCKYVEFTAIKQKFRGDNEENILVKLLLTLPHSVPKKKTFPKKISQNFMKNVSISVGIQTNYSICSKCLLLPFTQAQNLTAQIPFLNRRFIIPMSNKPEIRAIIKLTYSTTYVQLPTPNIKNNNFQITYMQFWKMIVPQPLTVENLFKFRKESHLLLGLIKVFILKSSTTSISYVQPTVKLVDALSTVGGVWGLWIGLSVSIIFSQGIETLSHFKKAKKSISQSNKSKATLFMGKHYCFLMHDMLWWTGIIAIMSVYIWQTYLTINEYLQFKVIQVVSTEPQDNNSFPTVYACSNTFSYYTSKDIKNNTDLEKKVEYLQHLIDEQLPDKNEAFYVYNLTDTDKMSLLPSVKDFITSCKFYSDAGLYIPCRFQKIKFFEKIQHVLGSARVCAIISPEFPILENIVAQNLILHLKYPKSDANNNVISTRIGFDPFSLLDTDITRLPLTTFSVTPGNRVVFKYSMAESQRLAYPYTSNCVPSNTTYDVWPDEYKDLSRSIPYSYTYETCLHLCFTSPIVKYKCDDGSSGTSSCIYDASGCGCQYPCKSVEYSFKVNVAENVYKQKIAYGHYNSISELKDYMWSGESVVEVERESAFKTVKAEKPAVQPDSLVGIIGGISGLWVGQSILNLFVELQRLVAIFFAKLNPIKMKI